jgi:hypothetical protein
LSIVQRKHSPESKVQRNPESRTSKQQKAAPLEYMVMRNSECGMENQNNRTAEVQNIREQKNQEDKLRG